MYDFVEYTALRYQRPANYQICFAWSTYKKYALAAVEVLHLQIQLHVNELQNIFNIFTYLTYFQLFRFHFNCLPSFSTF